jgi:hypothetical protein
MGMKGQNKKGILPIEQYDKELQPHIVSPAEVREKAYDPIWPVSKPSKWD